MMRIFYIDWQQHLTGNATEPWILVRMHMANEQYQQNSHKYTDL